MSDILVFDTESDGLVNEATRLWCIATRFTQSRQEKFFGPEDIEEGLEFLASQDVIACHNIFGHDLPLIKKLYPDWVAPPCEDTLILSRLYNPDRQGGHSIDAWGKKYSIPKPVHEDWTQFSDDMQHRCTQDTRINTSMIGTLAAEMKDTDWVPSIDLEYRVQKMQSIIESRGIRFDAIKAQENYDQLQSLFEEKESAMLSVAPPKVLQGTEIRKPWKKNGDPTVRALANADEDHLAGPFTPFKYEPFNLNSPQQVNNLLLSVGWEPIVWNFVKAKRGGYELNSDGSYKRSSPQVCEDSLEELDHPFATNLKDYRVLKHRKGILSGINAKTKEPTGWLNKFHTRDGTTRLRARGIPLGTNTGRYAHTEIVNMPNVEAPHGLLIRELLIPDEGMIMAGTDAEGAQARLAGHFTHPYDGGDFATEILEGDIHGKNAQAFTEAISSEVTRRAAKNLYYGIIFGATYRKIASMLGISGDAGRAILDAFWEANPALAECVDDTKTFAKAHGYIEGIDGRRITIRSPHSAYNARLQSAEAIFCKTAFVHCHEELTSEILLTMHDEQLSQLRDDYLETYLDFWALEGPRITEHFNFNVPMGFDTKTGMSYAECH